MRPGLSLAVGDLVARVEAPTVLYRVTSKHPGYVRILPYQRSGREVVLTTVKHGGRTIWAGDGSQWVATTANPSLQNVFLKKEGNGWHIDAEYRDKTINYGPFRTKERAMRMREAVIESDLQRNPIDEQDDQDDQDLADFVRGKFKYDPLKRARLAYVVEAILRERGVLTAGADHAGLVELARAELAKRHKTNPSGDADDAIEKYKQFHRYDPKKIEEVDIEIPRRVRRLGPARDVLYRSAKVDPATLKKPKRPVDYIHEHDAGVIAYACDGKADTDVPDRFVTTDALVFLGKCLGFALRDGREAQVTSPLPDLCCTPDGKCLLVIEDKRRVVAMLWGGNLGVHPRGIDG